MRRKIGIILQWQKFVFDVFSVSDDFISLFDEYLSICVMRREDDIFAKELYSYNTFFKTSLHLCKQNDDFKNC